MTRLAGVVLVAATVGAGANALAQDWPQWRGQARDGRAVAAAAVEWPERLSLRWRIPVGEGHASPIVVGRRTYVHTRVDGHEVVHAIDLDSGRSVWRQQYMAPYRVNPAARSHGPGPKSTPVAASGRLFTLGISGILTSWDLETGQRHWQHDFSDRFSQTSPIYGTAMSPLVDGDLVIAHLGGHDDGALMAFDTATGELRWRWEGDGPAYASPVIAEFDGVRQVVTFAQDHLVGITAGDGRLLWQVPFSTNFTQNSVTPVVHGDRLIYSGLEKGVTAVTISRIDGRWIAENVWENTALSMYMSSPVISGDVLYGLSHRRRGQFFCLDLATGRTLWTTAGREGDHAAIVLGDEALFLLRDTAELVVAARSRTGFEPIRRYTVADTATWAHPVVIGSTVLVKDRDSLALWVG